MKHESGKFGRRQAKMWPALVTGFAFCACAEQPAPEAPGTHEVDLVGMYTYMADAAAFEDCGTGTRYPVVIDRAHLDVERAYLELRAGPGVAALLSARFEIIERAPEPGMPLREFLRVVRFGKLQPGEQCSP